MRIGYDVSILQGKQLTGVEKLAYNIFKEMWKKRPGFTHYLICKVRPSCLIDLPENCIVVETGESKFWRWFKLRKVLKSINADCLISGVTNTTFPCGIDIFPYVHECQWRYNTKETGFLKQKLALKLNSLWAKAIITNSKYTKNDIEKELFFKRDIILAPPSYSMNYNVELDRKAILSNFNIRDGDYYLFASSVRPKKNVELLIDVFRKPEMSKQTLILAGKVLDENLRLKASGAHNIHFLGYVSDEALAGLYKNAKAFLYVSLNEGFGLPILESYYYGTPVIASQCGSIPEVAGDAAIYISGKDVQELSDAINNFSVPENFESKARAILDKYSWTKSAETILNYLEKRN